METEYNGDRIEWRLYESIKYKWSPNGIAIPIRMETEKNGDQIELNLVRMETIDTMRTRIKTGM